MAARFLYRRCMHSGCHKAQRHVQEWRPAEIVCFMCGVHGQLIKDHIEPLTISPPLERIKNDADLIVTRRELSKSRADLKLMIELLEAVPRGCRSYCARG